MLDFAPQLGLAQQFVKQVPEQEGNCVTSRDDELEDIHAYLIVVEFQAFNLRLHQPRDEVIWRFSQHSSLVDHTLDIVHELLPALETGGIMWDGRTNLCRPATEPGAMLLGYTDQVRSDDQWKRNSQVFHHIGMILHDQLFQELICRLLDK